MYSSIYCSTMLKHYPTEKYPSIFCSILTNILMNSDIVECVGWVSRVATICAGLRKYWWIALEQIVRGSTHPEEHELAEAPLLWENFSQKYSEVIFILWSQYWLIRVILKICSLQRKPDNCNANSSPFPHPPPQQHQASHRHTFQLDIILLPQIFPALVALQLKFGSICMLTVGSPSAGGCPVSGVTKWSSPVSPRIPISMCLHSHLTFSTSPITPFYYQANLCPSHHHWKKIAWDYIFIHQCIKCSANITWSSNQYQSVNLAHESRQSWTLLINLRFLAFAPLCVGTFIKGNWGRRRIIDQNHPNNLHPFALV